MDLRVSLHKLIYGVCKGIQQVSYRALYMRSMHWRRTRASAFRRYGRICARCKCRAGVLDVHHLTYRRLGHERHSDVIVLCRSCHAGIHKGER